MSAPTWEELSCDECNARTDALTAECDQLRAEVDLDEALQLATERSLKNAIARAERAEAELTAERARLDWLESDSGVDWQWSDAARTVSRASIDVFMKEETK